MLRAQEQGVANFADLLVDRRLDGVLEVHVHGGQVDDFLHADVEADVLENSKK